MRERVQDTIWLPLTELQFQPDLADRPTRYERVNKVSMIPVPLAFIRTLVTLPIEGLVWAHCVI